MRNKPAASAQDAELVVESELCTTLLIASSDRDGALTQDEVDVLLGVGSGPWSPVPPWAAPG